MNQMAIRRCPLGLLVTVLVIFFPLGPRLFKLWTFYESKKFLLHLIDYCLVWEPSVRDFYSTLKHIFITRCFLVWTLSWQFHLFISFYKWLDEKIIPKSYWPNRCLCDWFLFISSSLDFTIHYTKEIYDTFTLDVL